MLSLHKLFETVNIDPSQVRLMNHYSNKRNDIGNVLTTFQNDINRFEIYQSFHKKKISKSLKKAKYIASFTKTFGTNALFLGIWQIYGCIEQDKFTDEHQNLLITHNLPISWLKDGHAYFELTRTDILKNLSEQMIIDWGYNSGNYVRKEDMVILEMIPKTGTYSKTYFEGRENQLFIKAYERNTKARKKCIETHGYNCKVCNMNFEKIYGKIGSDFIHVHHSNPLSETKKNHHVDPEKDLVPVCPNCHAMLHRENPPLSIEELKKLINIARS